MVQLLRTKGAILHERYHLQRNVLHYAAQIHGLDIIQELLALDSGNLLLIPDSCGHLPSFFAAETGSNDVYDYLRNLESIHQQIEHSNDDLESLRPASKSISIMAKIATFGPAGCQRLEHLHTISPMTWSTNRVLGFIIMLSTVLFARTASNAYNLRFQTT